VPEADVVHRNLAIIETVFADLIDGPLAHLPGRFGANSAWVLCAPSPATCCAAPGSAPGTGTAMPTDQRCTAHRQHPGPKIAPTRQRLSDGSACSW
jgi:hypothetical protein